jgi:twitching motility two-component system response regulator PilH
MDTLALKHVLGRMWRQKEDTASPATTGADAAVLIVDDSRTALRAFALMLEREGYLTIPAVDGQQAIYLAKRHKPDLILMDIVMPRMNGFEATRILVGDPDTKHIPIVMVSGSNLPSDQVWGMRLGAKGFLAKPVTRDALMAKVRAVLAHSRRAEMRAPPLHFPAPTVVPKY